jgi:phage terminase large subunit GpA-like protein
MSAALAMADLGAESRPNVRGPVTRAPGSRLYTFRFTAGDARVFRPREMDPRTGQPLTAWAWADRYRTVNEGQYRGPWSTDLVAYAREPMEAFSSWPFVRRIILCWPAQSSKTQVALNCLAHAVDQDPGPALCVLPNENKAKDYVNHKLKPMFRTSPRLSELLSDAPAMSAYSIQLNNGARVRCVWATSAAELAQDSYRYTIRDETDKYPEYTGQEADPMGLIDERSNAFPHTAKDITLSTPTLDTGIIWVALNKEADEIREYRAVCPICGTAQFMRFGNITWPMDVRDWRTVLRNRLAHYSCESCGMKWDDRLRNDAVRAGYWEAREPVPNGRPSVIGYWLPGWYSPFISLSKCAAAYMRSQEDRSKLVYYVTQIKVEGYSERIEEKTAKEVLALKTDMPARVVHPRALVLTIGIDTHKYNFRYVVRAWSGDLTNWLVDYGELTSTDELETLIFDMQYPVAECPLLAHMGIRAGLTMGIWRAAIDTGGSKSREDDDATSRTEEIYEWLRKHSVAKRVFGIKGASVNDGPRVRPSIIDKFPRSSKPIPGGLELHLLNTAEFKRMIHWRMGRLPGETQRFHLHSETGEEYASELLAEVLHRDRHGREEWRKVRTANHYLDCEVYAAACADPTWFPAVPVMAPVLTMHRQAQVQKAIVVPTPAPRPVPAPQKPISTSRAGTVSSWPGRRLMNNSQDG